jgi:hypothetical protein
MICAAAVLILAAGSAQADIGVWTFDELSTPPGEANPIPNGYGGFNWENMYYLDPVAAYPVSGYMNGMVSQPHVAFNAYARAAAVSDGIFDFGGAALTGAWNDGLNIQVDGLLGGNLIYSQTVQVDTSGPTWFDFNYYGIDRLEFSSWGGVNHGYPGSGTHFAMDNFTIVPIPGAVLLGILGLSVAGVKLRKFV